MSDDVMARAERAWTPALVACVRCGALVEITLDLADGIAERERAGTRDLSEGPFCISEDGKRGCVYAVMGITEGSV